MEPDRIRYRKLPGRRRGFIFGSSVWMGPDHLLLVKSARFREEYRRFHFRDIQAIVVAKAPRFHISTRAALIGTLWLYSLLLANMGLPLVVKLVVGLWGVVLVADWVYVSAVRSCRCRIYTAVSSEELPSVYRASIARRFLAEVEPVLAQTQGVIEGDWAEAVEHREIGPPAIGRIGFTMPGASGPPPPPPLQPPSALPARTPTSILFVALLCLGGLADLLAMRASATAGHWILLGFLMAQMATVPVVMVQSYQGKLCTAMRNLAIAFLVSVGVWYYAVQVAAAAAFGYENAKARESKVTQPQLNSMTLIGYPASRGAAGVIAILFGLAGVVVLLRGERAPEEKVSFNV